MRSSQVQPSSCRTADWLSVGVSVFVVVNGSVVGVTEEVFPRPETVLTSALCPLVIPGLGAINRSRMPCCLRVRSKSLSGFKLLMALRLDRI